jgi:hypothetical protein
MTRDILQRIAISDDARRAAERSIAHGVDQPNPHVPGSAAHAAWDADYARWRLALIAGEDTEAGA